MHSLQCPKISGNAVVRIVSTKHLIEVLSLLPNRFVPHSPHLVLQAHKRPSQACERGTPQGGVASPLLSNVLLTPFDQEMRRKGYQLTRFADDWVITCKSAAEARAALAAATRILEQLGVRLSPQKTRIIHVQQGFDFLGYRIVRTGERVSFPATRFSDGTGRG